MHLFTAGHGLKSEENDRNLVVWRGSNFPLRVEVDEPIITCTWVHNGIQHFITEKSSEEKVGAVQDHSCLKYIYNVSQADDGEWIAIVGLKSVRNETKSFHLTVLGIVPTIISCFMTFYVYLFLN